MLKVFDALNLLSLNFSLISMFLYIAVGGVGSLGTSIQVKRHVSPLGEGKYRTKSNHSEIGLVVKEAILQNDIEMVLCPE